LEAADVLVGDPASGRSFEARNRLLAEFDVGVFGDKDHALRFGLDGYDEGIAWPGDRMNG